MFLLFYLDMRIVMGHALSHCYMLKKSIILWKHGTILFSLTLE